MEYKIQVRVVQLFLSALLFSVTAIAFSFEPNYFRFWLHTKEELIPPHDQHGSYFAMEPLPSPISFEKARSENFFPGVHIPGKPDWQRLNENTWRAFFHNLRPGSSSPDMAAYVSPRVSTRFSRNEFFWDQAFISLGYGLYGHRAFNTLGGLDCFYNQQHPDGFIPREIKPNGYESRFFPGASMHLYVNTPPITDTRGEPVYDPDLNPDHWLFRGSPEKWSQYERYREPLLKQREAFKRLYASENNSNPPLAAHAEWRHYLLSRNLQRLVQAYPALQAHTRWLENKRQLQQGPMAGLFWQRPMGSGMDNLPVSWMLEDKEDLYFMDLWHYYLQNSIARLPNALFFQQTTEQKQFASFDISAQMKLHYDAMAKIAEVLGNTEAAEGFQQKAEALKQKINQCLWDEGSGFYFDVYSDCKYKSIQYVLSAYWALYANIASTRQAERMLGYLQDEQYFNTPMPFPALATLDGNYYQHGNYWQGGVWPPLVYITIKGLMNYARELPEAWDIAIEASTRYLDHLATTMFHPGQVDCDQTTNTCPASDEEVPEWQRIYEYNSPSNGGPGQRKDTLEPSRFAKGNFVGWGGLGPIGLMQEVVMGIDVRETEILWYLHSGEELSLENLWIGNGSIDLRVNDSGEISVENARSLPSSITGIRVIPRVQTVPEFTIPVSD